MGGPTAKAEEGRIDEDTIEGIWTNTGGGGADKINSGQGDDTLEGLEGADKFICGNGYDKVTDFSEVEDDKATGNCEEI